MFPGVAQLDDLMKAPHAVKYIDTDIIRIFSPKGSCFEIPFHGFTVNRAAMDQAIAAEAVEEGAKMMTSTTALDVRGNKVVTSAGIFEGKVKGGRARHQIRQVGGAAMARVRACYECDSPRELLEHH